MLDIEMDAQAPNFEKRFITRDEDMRGSPAFSKLGGRALTELQKIAKRT